MEEQGRSFSSKTTIAPKLTGKGNYVRDEVKHAKQLEALRSHASHKSLAAQIRKDVLREQELLEEQKASLERINKVYEEMESRLLSKVSALITEALASHKLEQTPESETRAALQTLEPFFLG